jgi:hypothetical protein
MSTHGVPGGALYLSSTSYPDLGRCGNLSLQGKIPTVEPVIASGTSWFVVSSSDHKATRRVSCTDVNPCNPCKTYVNIVMRE